MKPKYSLITIGSAAIILSVMSGAAFADAPTENSYCSSPLLYATNIRETCEQYGASGMASLYQSSEFITGLKNTKPVKAAIEHDLAS